MKIVNKVPIRFNQDITKQIKRKGKSYKWKNISFLFH